MPATVPSPQVAPESGIPWYLRAAGNTMQIDDATLLSGMVGTRVFDAQVAQ
ncbi:MAG: hypothetical protein WBY44_02760 [Bryobacteraceae bacterium]